MLHIRIKSENKHLQMEYDGPRTIVDTMIRVWNALQLSEDIQKTFTAAATESGEANEDPDGGNERLGNSINVCY